MSGKKELEYYTIGNSFGGSQMWPLDPWMRLGGCGAFTFCDMLIYLTLHKGCRELYPFNSDKLTKKDYVKFGAHVKPYLHPRDTGIKDVQTYVDGVKQYFEDSDVAYVGVDGFEGTESFEKAAKFLRNQIDSGMPVPFLLLKHMDREFDDFLWHWFILLGYEERGDRLFVKAATFGKAHWLDFGRMWETGYDEKGGMVKFTLREHM